MKARFKYRIYPTPGKKYQLAKLFSCVRVVWNDSLACCQEKYTSGEKNQLILNYKSFLLLKLKKLKTESGYQKFLLYHCSNL